MKQSLLFIAVLALVGSTSISSRADEGLYRGHALAMFEDLKYGPEFTHFDYVNPQAPKGGEIHLAWIGTFDNLNPFTIKGVAGAGTLSIKRNTTVVFISDSETTFDWDLKGAGISLSANNDQAINVTFSDANSTAIIELQKTTNYSTTEY